MPIAQPDRKRSIDLWCNTVAGGWEPGDLETGLGGSEECIVLWARALAARGHLVRVYRNGHKAAGTTGSQAMLYEGVSYLPHEAFDPFAVRDVLVSWKSPHPWRVGARAEVRIHWSSDVEPPWPAAMAGRVSAFVTLTPYHRDTMPWLPEARTHVIPHGVDLAHLDAARAATQPGRALYCSSPDRGLLTLLRDWPGLRERHPALSLDVCYGWHLFDACMRGHPAAQALREEIGRRLAQPGIRYRGQVSRDELARLYWQAEYWMLPLQRAESELFCLNAVKANHCGAVAVIHRLGALPHTATHWTDYAAFAAGDTRAQRAPGVTAMDWSAVIDRYWEPLFRMASCTS